jgi:hypothetical protein
VQSGCVVVGQAPARPLRAPGLDGPLTCAGNRPAPADNGLPNTGTGARLGQCAPL